MSNVSHETSTRLSEFQNELLRWNQRINLIGRGTAKDVADRHVQDSVQLWDLVDNPKIWCDMGSGGGFPGLVVAICGRESSTEFTLIESDRRKAEFLSHISRMFDLKTQIVPQRIEDVSDLGADVISARALAPLSDLLRYGSHVGALNATYLFPKGMTFHKELEAARNDWSFSAEAIPSKTAKNSVILKIKDLARA